MRSQSRRAQPSPAAASGIHEGDCAKGCYFKPTLITNVTNDMRVAQEEIFGPVAVVIKFKTEDEVIAMANDSVYGLGGAVWTTDISKAIRVSRAIETGRMWVNTYNQIPAGAPFGGYKQSGIGRETDLSILDAYTQQKNIFINLDDDVTGFYPEPIMERKSRSGCYFSAVRSSFRYTQVLFAEETLRYSPGE